METLATMTERVRQVMKQTKLRIFTGVTQSQEKIVSVFEPHTEIIRKGKASKPTEFGKLVKIQESENQIISHFEVFAERPSDRQLLVDWAVGLRTVHSMRILIAEDDEALAKFVRQGLEGEHYSVDVLSDGEQARTAATEFE